MSAPKTKHPAAPGLFLAMPVPEEWASGQARGNCCPWTLPFWVRALVTEVAGDSSVGLEGSSQAPLVGECRFERDSSSPAALVLPLLHPHRQRGWFLAFLSVTAPPTKLEGISGGRREACWGPEPFCGSTLIASCPYACPGPHPNTFPACEPEAQGLVVHSQLPACFLGAGGNIPLYSLGGEELTPNHSDIIISNKLGQLTYRFASISPLG